MDPTIWNLKSYRIRALKGAPLMVVNRVSANRSLTTIPMPSLHHHHPPFSLFHLSISFHLFFPTSSFSFLSSLLFYIYIYILLHFSSHTSLPIIFAASSLHLFPVSISKLQTIMISLIIICKSLYLIMEKHIRMHDLEIKFQLNKFKDELIIQVRKMIRK